jgi:hypothetical protein
MKKLKSGSEEGHAKYNALGHRAEKPFMKIFDDMVKKIGRPLEAIMLQA